MGGNFKPQKYAVQLQQENVYPKGKSIRIISVRISGVLLKWE